MYRIIAKRFKFYYDKRIRAVFFKRYGITNGQEKLYGFRKWKEAREFINNLTQTGNNRGEN